MASKSYSDINDYVYGFKIWKWQFTLKLGGTSGAEKPCCEKAKELAQPGLKRDSSWEFFRFGKIRSHGSGSYIKAGGCNRHRRNLDIIRDRSKSMANLYYSPLDDISGSDLQDEVDPDFEDESQFYCEINDAPWIKKNQVEIEPFPVIVEPLRTPQVPPKAPRINRDFVEQVPMLPPYPSTKATGRKRHYTGIIH